MLQRGMLLGMFRRFIGLSLGWRESGNIGKGVVNRITDTAFFLKLNYHEPTDVPSTLDYRRMREVCLGVAHFLLTG